MFRNVFCAISTMTSHSSKHISEEVTSKMLHFFNQCGAYNLQSTKCFSQQLTRSVSYCRKVHGMLGSLSEIVHVSGLNVLGAQDMCGDVKCMDSSKKRKKSDRTAIVRSSPPVPDFLQQLHMMDSVTYTHMSCDLCLLSWGDIPIFPKTSEAFSYDKFRQKVVEVYDRLPTSDVFAMESHVYRNRSLHASPFLTSQRVLEAMLMTHLCAKSESGSCVFSLRPNTVMQFFSLALGGERLSGQEILRDLYRPSSGSKHSSSNCALRDVVIEERMWRTFWDSQPVEQERLTNCLLLSVTFMKLVMLKTHSLSK